VSRSRTKKFYRKRLSPEGVAAAEREMQRSQQRNEIIAAQVMRKHRSLAPSFHCNHDVPWKECIDCSKPRVPL
jgi:hypothetical protein